MVETLMFYLLALALTLAPASDSQVRIDLVDLANGEIESLVATRTDEGWRLEQEGRGGEALIVKRQGDGLDFQMPGEKEPMHVGLPDAAVMLPGATAPKSITLGDQEYTVLPSGAMYYILAKGREQLVTVRPMGAAAAVQATGTLRYKKVEPAMTPEAYQGIEFTLEREGQDALALSPSDAVSHDALVAMEGKTVEVSGVMTKGRDPLPGEAYPMGPDGKPLPRVDRLEVRSIRESAK